MMKFSGRFSDMGLATGVLVAPDAMAFCIPACCSACRNEDEILSDNPCSLMPLLVD
jgi:hypothetical protein